MARIVAISDAHLGRTHYQSVNERGLNQREADFAESWHRAVAAALDLDPDAVLVLGDLFDAPRLRESGSPYAVLADAFPAVHFAYRGAHEAVDLVPGLRVHAVPQCTST